MGNDQNYNIYSFQVLPQQYQQVQPGGFPAVYQQQPQQQQQQFSSSGFPPGSGQPNFNQQQPASRPAFPQQSQQQFPPQQQGHTSIPPTIMGFKTIQDVEKEMMYGSQAAPAPQPNYMPRLVTHEAGRQGGIFCKVLWQWDIADISASGRTDTVEMFSNR